MIQSLIDFAFGLGKQSLQHQGDTQFRNVRIVRHDSQQDLFSFNGQISRDRDADGLLELTRLRPTGFSNGRFDKIAIDRDIGDFKPLSPSVGDGKVVRGRFRPDRMEDDQSGR